MSDARSDDDTAGCLGCLGVVVVTALVVAGLISVAALVDPFSWMPPVGEIWADCEEDHGTERAECALENRFPGFWIHAVVNLVYAAGALTFAVVFAGSVTDLREKRVARFSSAAAAGEYRQAQHLFLGYGLVLGALALVPIVAAAV